MKNRFRVRYNGSFKELKNPQRTIASACYNSWYVIDTEAKIEFVEKFIFRKHVYQSGIKTRKEAREIARKLNQEIK